jgi:hypothetical protein
MAMRKISVGKLLLFIYLGEGTLWVKCSPGILNYRTKTEGGLLLPIYIYRSFIIQALSAVSVKKI